MKYKLIAIDLDDTLLNSKLEISERNKKAIAKAAEKGVKIVLATGRFTKSTMIFYKELNLNTVIIPYQGATVINPQNNEILKSYELSLETAREILRYTEKRNIHANIYIDDIIYCEKKTKWLDVYNTITKAEKTVTVGKLSEYIKAPTLKIVLIDSNGVLVKIKEEAEKLFSKSANIFFSKDFLLEFANLKSSKGQALKFVCEEYYKIKQEEVIAIGDTYNDIDMIEYAGLGVCMENGTEKAKSIADYITKTNEQDGVAHIIEKFVL